MKPATKHNRKLKKAMLSLTDEQEELFDRIDSYIETAERLLPSRKHGDSVTLELANNAVAIAIFKQIKQGMEFEVTYPELLAEGRCFMEHINSSFPVLETGKEVEQIKEVYKAVYDRMHPLRASVFFFDCVPFIRDILKEN